jgi:hypothetical protein
MIWRPMLRGSKRLPIKNRSVVNSRQRPSGHGTWRGSEDKTHLSATGKSKKHTTLHFQSLVHLLLSKR